mgnify:CR=1 FL=1
MDLPREDASYLQRAPWGYRQYHNIYCVVLAQDQWDMQAQICQLLDELNLTLIGFYNATIMNAPSSRVTNNNTLTILADCLTLTNRVELAEKS